MKNPFTPGNGIEPFYLAGRTAYFDEFTRSLDAYAEGLPRNTVLFGLRGTGKTVLLKNFKIIAAAKNWITVSREFNDRFCDEEIFAEAIANDIVTKASEVSISKKIKEAGKRLVDILKPEELGVHGISYRPYYKAKRELLEDYLKEMLVGNWPLFKKSGKTGVVFLYDEFHVIQDQKHTRNFPLSSLLTALSQAQREGCKYFLCLCGLPNLKTNLKEAKTYTERMFQFKEVGNLSPQEAKDAIVKPLQSSRYRFEPALIERVVKETGGYPYFLQFYGYSLIDYTLKKRITSADFDRVHKKLINELDTGFFEDRFNMASDVEKKILIAMAKIGGNEIETNKINEKLKLDYQVLMNGLGRLIGKGLIYKVKKGMYAFTLPLFEEYVLRHHT